MSKNLLLTSSLIFVVFISLGQELKPKSEVQKKHEGKIVFSNEIINNLQENESTFITNWDMSKSLYVRMYYTKTIEQAAKEYAAVKNKAFHDYEWNNRATVTKITIDDKYISYYVNRCKDKDMGATWVTSSGIVYDAANPSNQGNSDMTWAIRKAFHEMSDDFVPGKYKMKIETYVIANFMKKDDFSDDLLVLLSSGELDITISQEAYKKYLENLCHIGLVSKNALKVSGLEDKVAVVFSKQLDEEALYVTISSPDWEIKRNNYGTPLYRYILTKVIYKRSFDGKTMRMEFQVQQDWDGAAYQTSVKYNNVFDSFEICSYCTDWLNSQPRE